MYKIDAWFSDGTFRTFTCDQRAASSVATQCAPIFEDLIEPFDPERGIVLATSCFYKNPPGSIPGDLMCAAGNDDVMFAAIIEPEMISRLVRLDVDDSTLFMAFHGGLQDLRRAREFAGRAGTVGENSVYELLVQASNVAFATIIAERSLEGSSTFVETSENLLEVRDEVFSRLELDPAFLLHCYSVHARLEEGKDPKQRLKNLMQDTLHDAREAEQMAAEEAGSAEASGDRPQEGQGPATEAFEGPWEAMAYEPEYGYED